MLQALYLTAFAAISFLAIRNLVVNLINFSREQNQPPRRPTRSRSVHPELLDDEGNVTDEPLLVIRSTNIEDARSRLDALYRGDGDDEREASL